MISTIKSHSFVEAGNAFGPNITTGGTSSCGSSIWDPQLPQPILSQILILLFKWHVLREFLITTINAVINKAASLRVSVY